MNNNNNYDIGLMFYTPQLTGKRPGSGDYSVGEEFRRIKISPRTSYTYLRITEIFLLMRYLLYSINTGRLNEWFAGKNGEIFLWNISVYTCSWKFCPVAKTGCNQSGLRFLHLRLLNSNSP